VQVAFCPQFYSLLLTSVFFKSEQSEVVDRADCPDAASAHTASPSAKKRGRKKKAVANQPPINGFVRAEPSK